MVRSSKYKLIYNCTPGMQYSPVDSYYEASWMQMSEENAWGRLAPHFTKAYFSRARPVFELFDMDADPTSLITSTAARKMPDWSAS